MSTVQPDFSVKRVLLVNHEEITNSLIRRYLGDVGFEDIDQVADGIEGWERAKTGEYDFIIMNWAAQGLPGLAFVNRLRRDPELGSVGFITFSPKLQREDFALISELPCAALVEKPLSQTGFNKQLTNVWREAAEYLTYRTKIADFLKACSDKDRNKAMTLFNKIVAKLSNPIPMTVLAAKLFRERGFLKEAENILRTAFVVDQTQLSIISELGKVLVASGRAKEAMKILNHASQYSPRNVERLLLMGEMSLKDLDSSQAGEHFRSVLKIDPQDAKGYHGMVLAKNMNDYLSVSNGEVMTQSFAGLLNIIGISMVRNGRHEDGIQQYQSAMKFVDSRADQSRLAFNVGLGYLRGGKETEALPWFQQSMKEGSPVLTKASEYVARLEGKVGSEQAEQPKVSSIPKQKIDDGPHYEPIQDDKKSKDDPLYQRMEENQKESSADYYIPSSEPDSSVAKSPDQSSAAAKEEAVEDFDDDPLILPTSLG